MGRGTVVFAVFALAVSAGCVRLGFWQLSRLHERRARNAEVLAMMQLPPTGLAAFLSDSARRFQRVALQGHYDFENEFVLTSRSRNGAPGVHLITPLLTGDGTVLVNRGWVYAPDGMRIDTPLWHEVGDARVEGYVDLFAPEERGPVSTSSVTRGVRRLDRDSIAARLPYPVADLIVVQRLDSGEVAATTAGIPVRVEPPPLNDGPHRAYAVQWFAFALVGVVGTAYVLARDRRPTGG
ncbi:MAG TPA: SURF1 family protein [Gemmatimonadaceae bacterium]|jgi:surfeit locus 1 family protein